MDKDSAPVIFFQGKWSGIGHVIEKAVSYKEELTFTLCRSEPAIVLAVSQFTQHAELGFPLHAENGFIKIYGPADEEGRRKVEATFSHPFSLQEVEEGTFDGKVLTIEATKFQRGPTA
jgi:hypothetical protein